MNCRQQALQFCLDPAVVAVIRIFNEFQFEMLHRPKLLQIQQLTLSSPKIFSITALSGQFPLRFMLDGDCFCAFLEVEGERVVAGALAAVHDIERGHVLFRKLKVEYVDVFDKARRVL